MEVCMSSLWKKIKDKFLSQMKLQNTKILEKSCIQDKRSKNSTFVRVTHPNDSDHHGSNLIFSTRDIILKSYYQSNKIMNQKAENATLLV